MAALIAVTGWAFVLSLILTPILRDIFRSYGVVDQPDNRRKIHHYPIPRVGGIAVGVSYFAAFWLASVYPGGVQQTSLVWTLLPSCLVVFATGIIDDLIGLKPWQKIAGQLAAGGLAYASGIRIFSVVGVPMGWWALPVTLLWLLACTNAFNLVDGLDGLAAGVGLFATLTTFTAALWHNNIPLAAATLPLAGCLLAFLCYNFNPATVFLGDGGSLLIGFLLGSYAVVWAQKSVALLGMTAPLMALALPLLDAVLSIIRRFLRRQPIFSADRAHIHHRLMDRGLTPRRAVLLVYAFSGAAAACSLIQSFTRNLYLATAVVLLFIGLAWIGVRFLSYSEFMWLGRFLRSSEVQRSVNAHLTLEACADALAAAPDIPACWDVLRRYYPALGFNAARFCVGRFLYRDGPAGLDDSEFCTLKIPLGNGNFLEFARMFDSPEPPLVIGSVPDTLRAVLQRRLQSESHSSAAGA